MKNQKLTEIRTMKKAIIKEIERRDFVLDEVRVEKRDDGSSKIIGHAAVFDQLSENLGCFREKIAHGAFKNAIIEDDVRALFNHDPNFVLGRNKSGTLRLKEDEKGLAVEIDPPDTQYARDLIENLRLGNISQMSFGFRTVEDHWDEDENGFPIRTLKEVRLFDVSPVTYPAYPQTDVAVRSLEAWRGVSENAGKEEKGKDEARGSDEFDDGYLRSLMTRWDYVEKDLA